jgi:hypothetical protein
MTNATSQGLLLHAHWHLRCAQAAFKGGAGAMGVPYVIVYVECDRVGVRRCKPHLPWTPQIGLQVCGIECLVIGVIH